MSKRIPIFSALINAVLLSSLQVAAAQGDREERHVLMLDYGKQGAVYTVDGRVPGAQEGLLRASGN